MTTCKRVGYLTELNEWTATLDGATTLDALRDGVRSWAPYVSRDALAVLRKMDAAAFARWRIGLASEREKQSAGEAWQEEFGALLLPDSILRAGMVAAHLHVPFGTALIRVREEKLKSRRSPGKRRAK